MKVRLLIVGLFLLTHCKQPERTFEIIVPEDYYGSVILKFEEETRSWNDTENEYHRLVIPESGIINVNTYSIKGGDNILFLSNSINSTDTLKVYLSRDKPNTPLFEKFIYDPTTRGEMTKIDPDGNIEYVQSGFFEFVVANSANIDSILNIRHKSISERAKQLRTYPD